MKLGGWWRLWVVVVLAYGIVLGLVFAKEWPSAEGVEHGPWLMHRMSANSLKISQAPSPKMEDLYEALRAADKAGDTPKAIALADKIRLAQEHPWTLDPVMVEAANGNRFELPAGTTKAQATSFADDYARVLNAEATDRRSQKVRQLLLAFFVPSGLLLLLGLAFSWVRKGFKPI